MQSSVARCAGRAASVVLVVAAGLAGACAGQSRTGPPARTPTLIGPAEIREARAAGVRDLFELVSRQRPTWLETRNDRSLHLETMVLVYHNETRLGGIEALRGYDLLLVESLRYLDAAQAGLLPGGGSTHVQGAIVITTGARPAAVPGPGTPPPHPASH